MTPWPVLVDERAFQPIPTSWLEHPNATIEDGDGSQLLAVSAARTREASLVVRYVQVSTENVLARREQSVYHEEGSVPLGLKSGSGWPRAIRATHRQPHDVIRGPERDHLRALWADRLDEIDSSIPDQSEVIHGV